MARIGVISLGCPKNVVDAEELLAQIASSGHDIETDPTCAGVLIVNTCGFIESAKEESIAAILDAVRYKTNGACRSVIVTGCLVQRYGGKLVQEIPEVDGFVGLGNCREIGDVIRSTLDGGRVLKFGGRPAWWTERRERVLSTPPWTAYLRIADGCDNRCSYCAIPGIRGGFRSRPERDVLEEASALAAGGVRELILVAQDVTRYGLDTHGELRLPRLLDGLSVLEAVRWVRLLYCYPTRITDELIGALAHNDKVCKYVDVPLQHCSEKVLRAMGRQGSRRSYLDLFAGIRDACPSAALRTTFMVGFPGETEREFEELLEFVREVRFDRVGAFRYSREDGTPAADFGGRVNRRAADGRFRRLMALQQEISLEKNRGLEGKEIEVLIESIGDGTAVGRSYRDAPDIDGLVYVRNCRAARGDFVSARVTAGKQYNLIAECAGADG